MLSLLVVAYAWISSGVDLVIAKEGVRTVKRGGSVINENDDQSPPGKPKIVAKQELKKKKKKGKPKKKNSIKNKSSNKPYFILHVGPPKTATTSLQTDFTKFNATLAQDRYYYAGRYYNPAWNAKLNKMVPNRKQSRLGDIIKDMFKPAVCGTKRQVKDLKVCVEKDLQGELSRIRSEIENLQGVLISDEGYSGTFKSSETYAALHDALADEWEVQIVFGYRRFFEWLPSDMFQRYRMDKIKGEMNWKNHWPSKDGPGQAVTLLFPWYYKQYQEMGHEFIDTMIDKVGDSCSIRILNLHRTQGNSLRTKFLCDILPNANNACAESKKFDKQPNLYESNYINDARDVIHVHYDMLITGAAALGAIDTNRFNRKELRTALRDYVEGELKTSPTEEFVLKCPDSSLLDEFLAMSLKLERKILGVERARKFEADSRAAFEEAIEKHLFCEVDVESTLAKKTWKSYFAKYSQS